MVKFGDAIDVKGIISLVTSRLAVGTRQYRNLYAMRLHHPGSGESYWLHQDTTMYQVNFIDRRTDFQKLLKFDHIPLFLSSISSFILTF